MTQLLTLPEAWDRQAKEWDEAAWLCEAEGNCSFPRVYEAAALCYSVIDMCLTYDLISYSVMAKMRAMLDDYKEANYGRATTFFFPRTAAGARKRAALCRRFAAECRDELRKEKGK